MSNVGKFARCIEIGYDYIDCGGEYEINAENDEYFFVVLADGEIGEYPKEDFEIVGEEPNRKQRIEKEITQLSAKLAYLAIELDKINKEETECI